MKLLKIIFSKWLVVAHIIGNFQSQVIMSIFYLVFFMPVGVVYRLFADPLKMKNKAFGKSSFQKWVHPDENLDQARKPF